MSILYRVPVEKDTRPDVEDLKERVDRLPYTANFALDRISFELRELAASAVRRSGGRVDGVLYVKLLQAGDLVAGTDPGGTEKLRAESGRVGGVLGASGSPADGETTAYLLCNRGGTVGYVQVLLGPPDSGGTGYRILRVPN